MKTRALIGAVAGVALALTAALPSFAASDLITVNPAGGTTTTDGLKLDIAFGQIQIGRNGLDQMYEDGVYPDPTDPEAMSNYFVVALNDGTSTHLIGSTENSVAAPPSVTDVVAWDSFTSESALTDSDRSGTVTNHLVQGTGADEVKLDVTWSYIYPQEHFNVKADLTLGANWSSFSHRLYWFTDAYLEGSDSGNQFGGTTPKGKEVAGVVNLTGTQIEAFRQVAGQSLKWFAGYYECPFSNQWWPDENGPVDVTGAECGSAPSEGGWVGQFADFPSVFATGTDIDNGFGVSAPLSSAATDSMTFDLIFASCLDGVQPLPCADEATKDDSNDDSNKLPNTGLSSAATGILGGSVALVLVVGLSLVMVRRRQRA